MIDKTITIKGATDKQLDELIARLEKENRLQNLIAELKLKSSSGYIPYDCGQEISTEKPIESLYHFGIPGMRWGRKKGKIRKPGSEDHEKRVSLSKKKIRSMSNAELKTLNERLQLEKQYKDLSGAEKSKGKTFVNKVLQNSGSTIATSLITAVGMYAVKKAIGKKFGEDTLKDIFPKKK